MSSLCGGGSIPTVPMQLRQALASLTRQGQVSPYSSLFSLSAGKGNPRPIFLGVSCLHGQKGSEPHLQGKCGGTAQG